MVVAFVATLDRAHHFKRLDLAIARASPQLGRRAGVHLVVAGGGELLDDFRAQAAAAGVGERVHFLGPVAARRAARRAARAPTSSCSPPSRRSRSGSS